MKWIERLKKRVWWILGMVVLASVGYATDITVFRHTTGYKSTALEFAFSEPTTPTIAIQDMATTAPLYIETLPLSQTASVKFSGLKYDTLYGVGVKIDGVWHVPGDTEEKQGTGYFLRTLKRWHFAALAFADDEKAKIIMQAINAVAPDKRNAIYDEMERLSRLAYMAVLEARQNMETKYTDILKEEGGE